MTLKVEKSVRYATVVNSLMDAWSFVMARVDEFTEPSIEITPMWTYSELEDGDLQFEVVVAGTIPDEARR